MAGVDTGVLISTQKRARKEIDVQITDGEDPVYMFANLFEGYNMSYSLTKIEQRNGRNSG